MRIAYRRMSGSVGLTTEEPGTRGAWVEKRVALMRELQRRGHTVDIVGKLSKASGGLTLTDAGPYDLMFVEFGSSNEQFNGAVLAETMRLAAKHKGPKVFLCDDPDLNFLWDRVPTDGSWSVWMNALRPAPLPKQPPDAPTYDFPFSVLQEQLPIIDTYEQLLLVYIGRPLGRAAAVKDLLGAEVPFVAYAKAAEWKAFPAVRVVDPPPQAERAAFYQRQLGCLALGDAKHKRYAWRTGRAFHALAAGCPVVAEHDHPGMDGMTPYGNPMEVRRFAEAMRDPNTRRTIVEMQRRAVYDRDRRIAEATFREFGL